MCFGEALSDDVVDVWGLYAHFGSTKEDLIGEANIIEGPLKAG
jgi:hypothetical protein